MTIPEPIFRPAFAVTRASHVVLRVADLQKSRAFYVDTLGFVVSDDDGTTLYLRRLEEGCHHVQVLTPDVRPACEFYMGMGFRLSEYIVQDGSDDLRAVFLQRKGNPHDIVFVNNAGPRLHHAAFTIPEVYHLMYICDLLGRNGFGASVEWGPGRHFGPGYARFVYLRDPDGHRIELFTNHYQTIDIEDEPIRWQVSDLNTGRWGATPPASWLQEASAFAGALLHRPAVTPAPTAAYAR